MHLVMVLNYVQPTLLGCSDLSRNYFLDFSTLIEDTPKNTTLLFNGLPTFCPNDVHNLRYISLINSMVYITGELIPTLQTMSYLSYARLIFSHTHFNCKCIEDTK